MTRAPEAVDKAVDAVRRAEHKLVESAADVATKTRRTRRKLARKAKVTRKDLAKSAKKAKETVQHLADTEPRRRRRWPWLLGLLIAAAGTVAVIRSKAGSQPEVFTPEPRSEEEQQPTAEANGRPQPAKPAPQPKK